MSLNPQIHQLRKKISKEIVMQAIARIESDPSILIGRESTNYDLILESGLTYPPILVLSESNKLIGGDPLNFSDFNNSTTTAFSILRKLGFEVIEKRTHEHPNSLELASIPKRFLDSCRDANLVIDENLAIRYIASLISKPFVILTGLSGSGKTQLALLFAKWLGGIYKSNNTTPFQVGEEVKSAIVTYSVYAVDDISVTFLEKVKGIKVTLPFELINEWMSVITLHKFSTDTSPRVIRETVATTTQYSGQINSFETHLKAAAFHLLHKAKDSQATIKNICLVPVGADWTNRDNLLGYTDPMQPGKYVVPENGALELLLSAKRDPGSPYFLILDEMNLSHVERYFSDFLSAMESGEPITLRSEAKKFDDDFVPHSIALPKNLFIVGTVNVDETTYMFSPKVLDRANVLEFRISEADMKTFLSAKADPDLSRLSSAGKEFSSVFLNSANKFSSSIDVSPSFIETLREFFVQLSTIGGEFGFRTAKEIYRFASVMQILQPSYTHDQILDAAIFQKLLPKIHGSRRKIANVLITLGSFCLSNRSSVDALLTNRKSELGKDGHIKFPLSFYKIKRMYLSLLDNGFASFAEA